MKENVNDSTAEKSIKSKISLDDWKRSFKIDSHVLLAKIREKFEQLTGFACEDLCSLEKFTQVMYRPTDPSSLGVARALFGLCMIIDVVEERGLAHIDLKWGEPKDCHFPLIHGMRAPPLAWMIVLFGLMWLGGFGIMLGYHYKTACALFALPYWYIHLLDKSYWNNHSYLFGIVALLFWGTGANNYLALDAKKESKNGKSVPNWNYFILKFQFFTLYFIAGLKKSSWEWLEGYAMIDLSRHWVFQPFKLFLSTKQIDYLIVHWFAFIFDLTVGFFMLFNVTRIPAMFFCAMFHLMNSRLFSIGMFPFVCLSTMPLFCRVDWPRKLARVIPWPQSTDKKEEGAEVEASREFQDKRKHNDSKKSYSSSIKQKLVTLLLLFHICTQFFLPYSHFITKGYNNWVPGLYGYSWDMMVHAWDSILVVVKVRDNQSGEEYFLDPSAWTQTDRWTKHGDMVRQYAHCIKNNLDDSKYISSTNLSIYVDVWCSLNGRFQQRLFNPHVDLLTAEWHPLKPVSYVMPLLSQFSSYRSELAHIERDVMSWSNYSDVLFVADYPGLALENYVASDLENVTLHVLEGEVTFHYVEYDDKVRQRQQIAGNKESKESKNEVGEKTTIGKGGYARNIATGRFHKVVTTSPHPASYMYTFYNRTKQHLVEQGMKETVQVQKPSLPLFKEIANKIGAFNRAFKHIVNAVLHLTLKMPMMKH